MYNDIVDYRIYTKMIMCCRLVQQIIVLNRKDLYFAVITKVDKEDKTNKLGGAVFQLWNTNKSESMVNWTKIAKFITDEFGTCKISGLNPEIDYAVTEVVAPAGYELCDDIWRINLTAPGLANAATHTFEDYKIGHSSDSTRVVEHNFADWYTRIKYIKNSIQHAQNR